MKNKGDGMTEFLLAAVFIGGLFLLFMMVRAAFADSVHVHVLSFDKYPSEIDDLNLFFISDIHRRTIHDNIINEAKGKADIVIIGGDLTEKGVPFSRVRDNLKKLSKIAPAYFIWGNNDYEVDLKQLENVFREFNVTVLKNEAAFLPGSNEKVVLVGTDFTDTSEIMRIILYSINNSAFRIVLSHNPALAEEVSEVDNVPLILSGHTHGGQIRILGFGPYEKGGIKKYPATTLFVSNGYGTSLLPLRLGAPAETHLITVKRNKGLSTTSMNHPASPS
ncbi:metallophosphoesterase [Siminovitchia terrae]|uniref:Metallophosphoesterase n=1 Tax=Siminovitchia terrae TaxID=1914933 RepID=A0A429X484_SIMTE|nr:metallophosphoesterase [Siminovitchia terrae]RST58206.1 metallophosphoesterase [Siminovitchia terrae]GIN92054.1 metallophosphoesterase [Siminovitchia terrae]